MNKNNKREQITHKEINISNITCIYFALPKVK